MPCKSGVSKITWISTFRKLILFLLLLGLISVHFNHHVGYILIVRTDCVKYNGIMLDKLHYHELVYYVSSHSLKFLQVM
jgi:hypothetical protein